MIKRIIFDIDNTLLDTKKDCIDCYQNYLKIKNYKMEPNDLFKILYEYEFVGNFEKIDLVNYLNQKLDNIYGLENLEELLKMYSNYSTLINENTKNILEYLSKKYEIVALTNWYKDCQHERLKKVGIDKYFKKIYGVEDGIKPNKETYKNACSNYQYEECLIIGDSLERDINIPKKLKMKTIYFNKSTKNNTENEINNLNELLKLL